MNMQQVDRRRVRQTVALLGELRVDLLGVHSGRLHAALVADAVDGLLDCRIACEADEVLGLVVAAPASYWWSLPARHWGVAVESMLNRARRWPRRPGTAARRHAPAPVAAPSTPPLLAGPPPRTWQQPGDAWRIIFIGTSRHVRGRGVAAALYRDLMAERSLVARIARDNVQSLRLHHAAGWGLYRDGDVALAVHLRLPTVTSPFTGVVPPPSAAAPPVDDPRAPGSCRTAIAPRSAAL